MSNLINSPSFLHQLSKQLTIEQILQSNKRSRLFGLSLTPNDALELAETRSLSLDAYGRVEIGGSTIGKIIEIFCDSSYLYQANYAETLHDLLETFYYFKNESLDLLSDDDLIATMKEYFEHRCHGSLELLRDRELERLARNIRYGRPADYNETFDEDQTNEEEYDAEY